MLVRLAGYPREPTSHTTDCREFQEQSGIPLWLLEEKKRKGGLCSGVRGASSGVVAVKRDSRSVHQFRVIFDEIGEFRDLRISKY